MQCISVSFMTFYTCTSAKESTSFAVSLTVCFDFNANKTFQTLKLAINKNNHVYARKE